MVDTEHKRFTIEGKMSHRKAPSYPAVLVTFRRLFGNSPIPDVRTPQELCATWGDRDTYSPEANRDWLRPKLRELLRYGLVITSHASGSKHTLERIQLTPEGRRILNEGIATPEKPDDEESKPTHTVTIDGVARDVVLLRKQHRDLKITFVIEAEEQPAELATG